MARHDFDGIEAVGEWVICERTGLKAETHGGLAVPETAQIPVWQVLSVGSLAAERAPSIVRGARLLFTNPTALFNQDKRAFALVRYAEVIAVMQMPEESRLVVVSNGAEARSVLQ